MDFKYVAGNFNYGVFLDYIWIYTVSFECNYVVIWNTGDFDDDVKSEESLIFFNAKFDFFNAIPIAIGTQKILTNTAFKTRII